MNGIKTAFCFVGVPLFLISAIFDLMLRKLFGYSLFEKLGLQAEGFAGLASNIGFAFYCGIVTVVVVVLFLLGIVL